MPDAGKGGLITVVTGAGHVATTCVGVYLLELDLKNENGPASMILVLKVIHLSVCVHVHACAHVPVHMYVRWCMHVGACVCVLMRACLCV